MAYGQLSSFESYNKCKNVTQVEEVTSVFAAVGRVFLGLFGYVFLLVAI